MKRIISIIVIFAAMGQVLTSCDREPTLQEYYVEKQDSDNFISIDLPSSIITLKEGVSKEDQKTLESVKKLNLLAFQLTDKNKADFDKEKDQIKKILKGKKFNDLMRVNHKTTHVIVKYLGTDDAIDEVVVFASDNKKGFALARVIGDDMKPDKIAKLLKNIKDIDKDNPALSSIRGLLEKSE